MTTFRWFRTGRSPRAFPALRRPPGRQPVVMLVLALAALSQAGCQSGPFGGCGACGGKVRNLSERVFRPIRNVVRGSGKCCGGDLGVEAAPGVQYGYNSSPSVVAQPSTSVPSGGPTTSGPSTVSPGSSDNGPPELLPIPSGDRTPSATPGPAPSGAGSGSGSGSGNDPASPPATTPSQGARSSPGKVNYEAYHPFYRDSPSRVGPPAAASRPKALDATPEPTTRSAQGASASSSSNGRAEEPNVLDNLPLLNLPLEVPQPEQSPPQVPSASREGRAPAAESLADLAAKPAAVGAPVAPGIRRFAGLEPKLAGGSLPDSEGLDWLAEKGYRTILDLREEADISPTFISEVTRRGMRYLPLPISARTVDAGHVSRFHFEISLSDARPLYFCDTDGTRAGVMWYVRRITVDKVGELVARRDAEELGLTDTKSPFWLSANAYLASLKPPAAPAQSPAPAPVDTNEQGESGPSPAPAPLVKPGATRPKLSRPGGPSTSGRADDSTAPKSARRTPADPISWKTAAAAAAAGLGIPLAYIGRSIPINLARASLPAPRRSARSLPDGSGVGT